MKLKSLLSDLLSLALLLCATSVMADGRQSGGVDVQLVRNATVRVTCGGTVFPVDPMLSRPGTYHGFSGTYRSELCNPLTPLPMPISEVLRDVDAVIVTHTHLDHWDDAAVQALPKDMPLFVQDEKDAALIRSQGFRDVRVISTAAVFGGVSLSKTACRHGSEAMYADPAMGAFPGSVMGIVFKAPGMPTVYLAADTVWFKGVEDVIAGSRPDVIILNTGRAALAQDAFKDDPYIFMGMEDVLRAVQTAPDAGIVCVHMDAINHMTVDRKNLSEYVRGQGIREHVLIPFDGEVLHF